MKVASYSAEGLTPVRIKVDAKGVIEIDDSATQPPEVSSQPSSALPAASDTGAKQGAPGHPTAPDKETEHDSELRNYERFTADERVGVRLRGRA